jgi:anti-sigma regulatory factor (Ser/Thr protein kinase)
MTHRWTLPGEPQAAGMARALVQETLSTWSVAQDAALVTSELVTNAVEHGEGSVDLELAVDDHRVRISVTSGATAKEPRRATATSDDEGGRGLAIVEQLGEQWGWHRHGDRLSVWADLVEG